MQKSLYELWFLHYTFPIRKIICFAHIYSNAILPAVISASSVVILYCDIVPLFIMVLKIVNLLVHFGLILFLVSEKPFPLFLHLPDNFFQPWQLIH